jgi:hypothetical protein
VRDAASSTEGDRARQRESWKTLDLKKACNGSVWQQRQSEAAGCKVPRGDVEDRSEWCAEAVVCSHCKTTHESRTSAILARRVAIEGSAEYECDPGSGCELLCTGAGQAGELG